MERNPQIGSRDDLFTAFLTALEASKDFDKFDLTIKRYYFDNMCSNILRRPSLSPEELSARSGKRAALVSQYVSRIDEVVNGLAEMKISDMLMPNGKALSECTGADCRTFYEKLPPVLRAISKSLKPRQKVGSVYSEEALQSLYK